MALKKTKVNNENEILKDAVVLKNREIPRTLVHPFHLKNEAKRDLRRTVIRRHPAIRLHQAIKMILRHQAIRLHLAIKMYNNLEIKMVIERRGLRLRPSHSRQRKKKLNVVVGELHFHLIFSS